MTQQPQVLETQIIKTIRLNYLLYLPPNYDATKQFPLILFLHGSGERGSDLEQIKRYGLPKIVDEQDDFPFIVVSPQCPTNSDWVVLIDDLNALLDHILAHYVVDRTRVYLTGLSMGGRGAYQLAFISPNRFAAMIVISARRPDVFRSPDRAVVLKDIPIRVFHGALDLRVPVEESIQMVAELQTLRADVQLTVYPDAQHDAWTRTYENPEIYTWLLAHKRGTE